MDMLDMLDETDCRQFKTEANYHYLNNFPQRQVSGCYSEVNILMLSEFTMKLRRSTVLKGRQQDPKNVVSVVLSDADSSQSDSVEEITDHWSVNRDMQQPIRKYDRASKKRPLSVVESQHETVKKISLAVGAMAEDTLEKLRLMVNTSKTKSRPKSPVHSQKEIVVLDDSSTDLTSDSGPSSPCLPVDTIRCRECKRLFAKVRRQPSPNNKSSDENPESLSCDVWVLLKKRRPQRHRHREKGLLWTSLRHIRKMSAQGSSSSAINKTQMNCSRPHVFQQRNLRRCKYQTSIHTDLSITKAKPLHRKKPRVVFPPIGRWNSSMKRKSSMNKTFSQQLSPLNLRVTQKDEPLVEGKISKSNAALKQNSYKQRSTNVKGKLEVSNGKDVTRRVLKFDETQATVEQKKSTWQIYEAQNEQQEESSEDSDWFRTPTDSLFTVKPKIKLGKQKKVSGCVDTKPTTRKPNFVSLLATMVKNQNQIISESCK